MLIGREVDVGNSELRDIWVAKFESNPVAAKPISFYTWSKTLEDTWRFMRYFQFPLGGDNTDIAGEIARVLNENPDLMADYDRVMQLYAKLTNPYVCLTVRDVVNLPQLDSNIIAALCQERGTQRTGVALLPASTSREQMLFERIFAEGVPADSNLMRELVQRIRSGEVDLAPTDSSGWYEHQVYALETLLLPEKGAERDKLLLSKSYKKRMLEAFKALVTKRRETHARQLDTAAAPTAVMPRTPKIAPRLRVEPSPTYYLRTARSYAFLRNVLEANPGEPVLASLHGLTSEGQRELTLAEELDWMRDVFYGLHLISAEDIGMKPEIAADEVASADDCYALALQWLETIHSDPDLAQDTRVSVPIMVDQFRGITRIWVTLGVRLTKLNANFATPPSVRPLDGSGEWVRAEPQDLNDAQYLIAVDEFAEVELPGLISLSREELRAICDQAQTKEAIIEALKQKK
jgi:hypothetical protein